MRLSRAELKPSGEAGLAVKPAKLATFSDTLRLPTTLSARRLGDVGETVGRHSSCKLVSRFNCFLQGLHWVRLAAPLTLSLVALFRYLFSAGFFLLFCISFFIHCLMIVSACNWVRDRQTKWHLGTFIKVRALHYCFFFFF